MLRHASNDVRNVKDELHVHGGLRDAGAASVDDGDQGAVQLVHVALGEELASAAGLVLHLRARQNTFGTLNLWTTYSGWRVTARFLSFFFFFLPYRLAWRCAETAC